MKYDRILIVVDMQKDFIDGALGTAEAVAITPAAAAKLRAWQRGCLSSPPWTPTGRTISPPGRDAFCRWSTASRARPAGS